MLDKNNINNKKITRRTFAIGLGQLGFLFLLAGRMFYMQFIKKDDYKTLSDKNSIKTIIINPIRGQIFDIDNKLIAKNNSCFKLLLDKNNTRKILTEVDLIIDILELDKDQIEELHRRIRVGSRRIPIILIDYLDWQQIAIIEERRPELKSIFIETGYDRYYLNGPSMAHIVGYMGRPSDKLTSPKFVDASFKVGKNGIESYYEDLLQGKFGYKRIEVNAYGKYVRELGKNESSSGANLHLNIDSELQEKTLSYLNEKGSSAIVMDCTNGAILNCCSSPTYDPNKFNNLSVKYWNELITNPYNPLIDKTIKSLYPPGSVFKIITALAALESGVNPEDKIFCTGKPLLGGNAFRCARRSGHGAMNMVDALKHSCNGYMYNVAKKIGPDKIIELAKRFGFGSRTGIDLPGELSGFVPSQSWKKEKYADDWRLGDTFNLAIGQGFLLSTPMQIARMMAAIASNGKLFVPKIAIKDPQYTQIHVNPDHLIIIKKALYATINSAGGTGYSSRINEKSILMAGKTGTSQVQAKKNANDDLSRSNINWNSRNHAIFSGYFPFDEPKYVISIYYDHGGGGGLAAAPIAKKIAQDLIKKYMSHL